MDKTKNQLNMQNKLRRFCVVILISLGVIDLYAQSNLNVKENSGNNSSFAITNIRKLTFSSGNLNIINLSGSTNSFGISAIKKLNFTSIPTSIRYEKLESEIQLYPNPTKDYFYIKNESALGDNITIEIIDLEGKILQKQLLQLPCRIDISGFKNGIYICRLNLSNKTENLKIIKQ